MSQNVHGIARDEYHPGAFLVNDVIGNAANDGCVLLEKLESCFTGSLCRTCCDHDYLRVCVVVWIADTNRYSWEECLPVDQVQNLPLYQIVVPVDDCDLFGQAALSKSVAKRRTNSTRANDNDFAPLH
jgi:hypothetical protein